LAIEWNGKGNRGQAMSARDYVREGCGLNEKDDGSKNSEIGIGPGRRQRQEICRNVAKEYRGHGAGCKRHRYRGGVLGIPGLCHGHFFNTEGYVDAASAIGLLLNQAGLFRGSLFLLAALGIGVFKRDMAVQSEAKGPSSQNIRSNESV